MVGTCIPVISGTNLTELANMWIENYPLSPGGNCGCSHTTHTGLIDYEVINNFQVVVS